MNSHQRRKVNRYWRHQAYIDSDTGYIEYMEIRRWCEQHLGKIGFRWGNRMDSIEFDFRTSQDYVLFTLRWI
jgi:hypothetical protein